MKLSNSNIKTLLIFSSISGNKKPEKIIYISGNRTFLYFRKNFPSTKSKKKLL